MKDYYAGKLINLTGQRSETVKYRKQTGKTAAVLFEMKASKWKIFHKVETHDLPFYLICQTTMKVTGSANCWYFPYKNTASRHIRL